MCGFFYGKGEEMKKISICLAFFIFISFFVIQANAMQYSFDFLEPGNPGGWSSSLKTFDTSNPVTISPGKSFTIDIWAIDVPESLVSSGFFMTYDPSQIIISVQAYSPWIDFFIVPPDFFGPGSYVQLLDSSDCVVPDAGGDVILARIWVYCKLVGSSTISISSILAFDTTVGCLSSTNYDYQMGYHSITITQTGCQNNADCDDGLFCNGIETCIDEHCQSGIPVCSDGIFCNGLEVCDESTDSCTSPGNPCPQCTICNDITDSCDPSASIAISPKTGTVYQNDTIQFTADVSGACANTCFTWDEGFNGSTIDANGLYRASSSFTGVELIKVTDPCNSYITNTASITVIPKNILLKPKKGGNTGAVTVNISGRQFAEGCAVKLMKGISEITGSDITFISPIEITASFDLRNQEQGLWDIVLINSDGATETFSQIFTVEEGKEVKLWADIIGRDYLTPSREYTYDIIYGNSGNIDATNNYLFLFVPPQLPYKFKEDNNYTATDETFLNSIFIRKIPPGTHYISFKVIVPTSFNLFYLSTDITPNISSYFDSEASFDFSSPNFNEQMLTGEFFAIEQAPAEDGFDDVITRAEILAGKPIPPGYVFYWKNFENPSGGTSDHVGVSMGGTAIFHMFPPKNDVNPNQSAGGSIHPDVTQFIDKGYFIGAFKPQGWTPARGEEAVIKIANVLSKNTIYLNVETSKEEEQYRRENNLGENDLTGSCLRGVRWANPYIWEDYETLNSDHLSDTNKLLNYLQSSTDDFEVIRAPAPPNVPTPPVRRRITPIWSWDPNDKLGPIGNASQHFISVDHSLTYLINFENLSTATAPAMKTIIIPIMLLLILIGASLADNHLPSLANIDANSKYAQASDFYVGVTFGGNTTQEGKILVDRVRAYMNVLVIDSTQILRNETALIELGDYAVASGLHLIVYFPVIIDGKLSGARFETVKERWGDEIIGVYLYDEPGGKQLDYGNWAGEQYGPAFNATTYSEVADQYVSQLSAIPGMSKLKSLGIPAFTADYGLYWFDYLAGYDCVLAEFGWNNSRPLQVAMVRGAANVQQKQWGVIITWEYRQPPFIEDGQKLLDDMMFAYNSGAQYVIVFNYPQKGEYGILQNEHFEAMKQFWNSIHGETHTDSHPLQVETVLVLPKDYGWGMMIPNDSVWASGHLTT
jgi:hypothetical protein